MSIRAAEPEDAQAIAEVHIASWQAAYRGIIAEDVLDRLDSSRRAKAWRELLGARRCVCYLSGDQGNVTGFVSLEPCRDDDKDPHRVGEVSALYVHPKRWRRGYGRALLQRGLTHCAAEGFREVTLWVLQKNVAGPLFYEHHGFRADQSEKVHKPTELIEVRYIRETKSDPGFYPVSTDSLETACILRS